MPYDEYINKTYKTFIIMNILYRARLFYNEVNHTTSFILFLFLNGNKGSYSPEGRGPGPAG